MAPRRAEHGGVALQYASFRLAKSGLGDETGSLPADSNSQAVPQDQSFCFRGGSGHARHPESPLRVSVGGDSPIPLRARETGDDMCPVCTMAGICARAAIPSWRSA